MCKQSVGTLAIPEAVEGGGGFGEGGDGDEAGGGGGGGGAMGDCAAAEEEDLPQRGGKERVITEEGMASILSNLTTDFRDVKCLSYKNHITLLKGMAPILLHNYYKLVDCNSRGAGRRLTTR